MQRFWVVYHGISHESLVFSRYILGSCVYQTNTSDQYSREHNKYDAYLRADIILNGFELASMGFPKNY